MNGFEKCQDVTIFFISITLLFWIGQCGMNYRVHNFAISNIALSHDITSRISQNKILLLYLTPAYEFEFIDIFLKFMTM